MGSNQYEIKVAVRTDGVKDLSTLGLEMDKLGKIESFKKLAEQVRTSSTAFKDAQAEVLRLAREMAESEKPTKAMASQLDKARNQVSRLAAAYDASLAKYRLAGQGLRALGVDTKNLKSEQLQLEESTRDLKREMKAAADIDKARGLLDVRPHREVRREIQRLTAAYNVLKTQGNLTSKELYQAKAKLKQKVDELNVSTNGWSTSISSARTGLAGLAAVGYSVVRSFSAYSEYTQKMSEVNTLVGQSVEKHKALSDEILDLTSKIPQTATELAAAEYDILSAGVALSDSTRVLEQAAQAAIGGVTDTKTAVNIGMGVLNAYGKGIDDLGGVYDVLFTTVKEGVTTFPELAQHMGEVLPTARAAHVAFGDVSAAIATMTKAGIRTPQAATAMKGAINAMAAPAPEAKKKFDELGITWNGLIPTLQQIKDKSLTIDQMRMLIPDVEARTGVLALTQNMDELEKILGSIGKSGGAAKKAFDGMKDTPENQIKMFKNEMNKLMISVGGVTSKLGLPFLTALREAGGGLSDLSIETQAVLSTLALGGSVFAAWQLGLGAMVTGLKGAIINARAAALANGTLVTSLTGPGGVVQAFSKTSLAMKAFLIAGAVYATVEIYKLVKAFVELKHAQDELEASKAQQIALDKEAASAVKDVAESLGVQATTLKELFALEKEGLIYYDQVTASWQRRGEEAKTAHDIELLSAQERIKMHKQVAAETETNAVAAIAMVQKKADAQLITEKQAADQIIGLNLAKYQQLLSAADQHVLDVERVEGANSDNYKAAVEAQKAAAQSLKDYKIQSAQEITTRLKSELDKQLSDEQRIKGEIESLHQKAADQLIQKEDELREIRRRGMSESQQQADLERQANEKLLAAKEALRKGDYERANTLAAQAKGIYNGLKDETDALAGVKKAWSVLEETTSTQESAKQAELKKTQEATAKLRKAIETVVDAVDKIAKAFEKINLQLAAEPIKPKLDDSELKQGIDLVNQLDGSRTESTHVLHFTGEGSEEKPISEKIADVKAMILTYREMAAQDVTSTLHFEGSDTDGTTGLTEKIAFLEQQLLDLQTQAETPITMTVDTQAVKDGIAEVDEALKREADSGTATTGDSTTTETDLIKGREIDDSKYRPEKDEEGFKVDSYLAQKIENKKTAMAMYQDAARASLTSGDGLHAVYATAVASLQSEINVLMRELNAKKERVKLNTGGSVPGTGNSDTVPAMLTPNEFVNPVASVKTYGVSFFEALRRRSIPRESIRALMSGVGYNSGGLIRSVRSSFSLPTLPATQFLNSGGSVRQASSVTERVQVDFNFGTKSYSGVFEKDAASGFIQELKRQKARAL